MKLTSKIQMWWLFNVYPFNFITRLGRRRQIKELKKAGYTIVSTTISTHNQKETL